MIGRVFAAATTTATPFLLFHDSPQAHSRVCSLTRLVAFLATLTLGLAVLFRSPLEYRTIVCAVVSVATITLAIRSLFSSKPAWALLFLAVLCMFTPFQVTSFSHALVSIVDMATLALFAASPMILRNSALAVARPTRS